MACLLIKMVALQCFAECSKLTQTKRSSQPRKPALKIRCRAGLAAFHIGITLKLPRKYPIFAKIFLAIL